MQSKSYLGTSWDPRYEHICKNIYLLQRSLWMEIIVEKSINNCIEWCSQSTTKLYFGRRNMIIRYYDIMICWPIFVTYAIILYCIIPYYTTLYFIMLYYYILNYIALYCIILYYTVLYRIILYYIVLDFIIHTACCYIISYCMMMYHTTL